MNNAPVAATWQDVMAPSLERSQEIVDHLPRAIRCELVGMYRLWARSMGAQRLALYEDFRRCARVLQIDTTHLLMALDRTGPKLKFRPDRGRAASR